MGNEEQDFPSSCYGYPDECNVCEIPRHYKKARIELTKLKLGYYS